MHLCRRYVRFMTLKIKKIQELDQFILLSQKCMGQRRWLSLIHCSKKLRKLWPFEILPEKQLAAMGERSLTASINELG